MSDSEFVDSWEQTRGHLSRAWVELPAGSDAEFEPYAEFFDHNELELAMDELAQIGRARAANNTFWLALADAANEMGLTSKASDYEGNARSAPEAS